MFNDVRMMEIVFWTLLGLVAVVTVIALRIISKYERHLRMDEETRKKALADEEERKTASAPIRTRRGERIARRTRGYRGN